MSNSPGGRTSPSSTSSNTASGSGSVVGSVGSNGCRNSASSFNSGASFDSGRATSSTTFQGVRTSTGGLSSESSLGSFRHSYHSSSSSLGSIPSEEIRNFDVAAMISQGVPDHEILNAWLTGIHLECYYQNFIQAGYDMHTISRMTPEDLNAIGVTKPHHRKKIKSEISQLNISEGLPEIIPESVDEWLRLLKLEEYLPRLLDQGYRTTKSATNITWEDLDDIGILKLGHQKKFMLALKRVQDILSGKRFIGVGHYPPPNSNTTPTNNNPQHYHYHHVPNHAYMSPVVDPSSSTIHLSHHHQQQQQHLRHLNSTSNSSPSSLPYPHSHLNSTVASSSANFPPVNNSQDSTTGGNQYHPGGVDPRHQIHSRNIMWPHQSQSSISNPSSLPFQAQPAIPPTAISHQIQVHHHPNHQPLYHPEVISIRVKNGHGASHHASNSMDSPEEEPIYGTSSFLPSSSSSHATSSSCRNGNSSNNFKSFEEGETSGSTGGGGSNLSMTKQSMSNTWTLPRLQKHKPISKVMGGGNCDSSSSSPSSSSGISYPINPGPFNMMGSLSASTSTSSPATATTSSPMFAKCEYASTSGKVQPPPPPRRSSCSSLGPSSAEDNNLPLPPPPTPPPACNEEMLLSCNNGITMNGVSRPPGLNENKSLYNSSNNTTSKLYGQISSNYYTQQRNNGGNNKIINPGTTTMNSNGPVVGGGGIRRSTLPLTKPANNGGVGNSRDHSPVGGGDFPDPTDLFQSNGFLCKVRRNGSDASFNSTSSTESESIPFANDNAGTIKQQKPGGNNGNGQSKVPSTTTNAGQEDENNGDVLSDIGSMLADLTDQLDAILQEEMTSSKR